MAEVLNMFPERSNQIVLVSPAVRNELDFIFRTLEQKVWDKALAEQPPKEEGQRWFCAVDILRDKVMSGIEVDIRFPM